MDGISWTLTIRLPEPDLDEYERLSMMLRVLAPVRRVGTSASGVEILYPSEARAREAMARVQEECPEACCVVGPGS